MSKEIDIDDPEFQAEVQKVMDELGVDRGAAEFIVAGRHGGQGDVVVQESDGSERSLASIKKPPSSWRARNKEGKDARSTDEKGRDD